MRNGTNFGARERARQAGFRATLSGSAHAPSDDVGLRNGHLLALGHELENLYPPTRRAALEHFARRCIKWWTSSRSGDSARRDGAEGPTRNMASSQVACVNTLLPLASWPDALAHALRAFDEDIVAVLPSPFDPDHCLVDFEWLGWNGGCLEGIKSPTRGANATSADAFAMASTRDGKRRAYIIEWKYVEEYPVGESKGEGKSGATRLARYSGMYSRPDSPMNSGVPIVEWLYEPLYQVMRLLLLAQQLQSQQPEEIDEIRVVVVCPAGNDGYRDRITSPGLASRVPRATHLEDAVKGCLKSPAVFSIVSPEAMLDRVRKSPSAAGPEVSAWIEYMHERYNW